MDLTIKKTPSHDGDGYSWGSDTILTVGSKAINFGKCENEANFLYKCWYDIPLIENRVKKAIAALNNMKGLGCNDAVSNIVSILEGGVT